MPPTVRPSGISIFVVQARIRAAELWDRRGEIVRQLFSQTAVFPFPSRAITVNNNLVEIRRGWKNTQSEFNKDALGDVMDA